MGVLVVEVVQGITIMVVISAVEPEVAIRAAAVLVKEIRNQNLNEAAAADPIVATNQMESVM